MISWLIVTILAALLPRIYAGFRRIPYLPPDGFSYLNLARILRNEQVPPIAYDSAANAPRDNQAFRTPGYPIFLNIVFALTGWKGTSEATIERICRHQGIQIDSWNLNLLRQKENLKAVQIAQHGLGLLATGLMFWLLWNITGSRWLAFAGSLFAVGWNPAWFWGYELSILTEILTSTLLLALMFFLRQIERGGDLPKYLVISSLLGSAIVLVRPQFLLAAILPLVWWLWKVSKKDFKPTKWAIVSLIVPPVMFIGGWIMHNYAHYKVWTISTTAGFNLCTHFTRAKKFDAFSDPILRQTLQQHVINCPHCLNSPDPRFAVIHIYPDLMEKWGLSFPAVSKRLERQAISAIINHPLLFLQSVAKATMEFFKPSSLPKKIKFLNPIWFIFALMLKLTGLIAILFVPKAFPPSLKVIGIFVAGTVLLTVVVAGGAKPERYGFPLEPVLVLLSLSVAWQVYHRWQMRNLPIQVGGNE